MKIFGACALMVVAAAFAVSPVEIDYHNNVGIRTAARIKEAEKALDQTVRIAGGARASVGEYPFFGGLLITMTNGAQSVCGSTLLSNTRSVTAVHCWRTLFSQAQEFTIVLGSTLLFSGGTRVTTSDVEVHDGYNMTSLLNDIAIIRLSWIEFNNAVHSIPIATGDSSFVGAWAQAIGFGRTSDGDVGPSGRILSHVLVQVISNAACATTYGTAVVNSTLCVATDGGRSTCNGDSGGPLITDNQLIGITSFGHQGDCQRSNPTGFSRVTCFAAWLHSRL